MAEAELEALVGLLNRLSVRRGHFTLASGRTSDLYVDVRQTSLHSEGAWLCGALLAARLRPEVVAVGGPTLGADPLVTATSLAARAQGRVVHGFLIRKAAKGHGMGAWLEGAGNLPEGAAVAILEDTTTTGGSLLEAVERARGAGLRVVQALTVVDREEGAAHALRAQGLTLEALVTRSQLDRQVSEA